MKTLIALTVLVTVCCAGQEARDGKQRPSTGAGNQSAHLRSTFQTIENAVRAGTLGSLSPIMGKQVSMTIRGNESGLYSSAQALTILRTFFSAKKVLRFSFSRIGESTTHPYGTGTLDYSSRGAADSLQIYVSLARQDSLWVVTQFNIY